MEQGREIRNAKITSTMLGFEGHGILTFILHLDYGGMAQGFGGYACDEFDKAANERVGSALLADAVMQLLKCLEIDTWEKLPGTVVRADASWGRVHRIGHFLKEQWFDIQKLAAQYQEARP